MITQLLYVHGLWLNGWESAFLRGRLARELQCETASFSYPSVSAGVAANARALAECLERMSADTLHLVGHSLGGLVLLELFENVLSADGRLPAESSCPPAESYSWGRRSRAAALRSISRGCHSADPSWA